MSDRTDHPTPAADELTAPPSRRQAIVATFGARPPVAGPPRRPVSQAEPAGDGADPPPQPAGVPARTVVGPPGVPARKPAAAPATAAPAPAAPRPASASARRGAAVAPEPASAPALPGSSVRRRQVMTVYLPAEARGHLYKTADQLGVPLGKVAMDALRSSYDIVRARLGTVDRSGLFPDERPRQRSRLDDPRGVSLSLSTDQAEAVGRVLSEFDCSASVLFSLALEIDLATR